MFWWQIIHLKNGFNQLNKWNMLFGRCKMFLECDLLILIAAEEYQQCLNSSRNLLISLLLPAHAEFKEPSYWLMASGERTEEVVEKIRKKWAASKLRWGKKSGLVMEEWVSWGLSSDCRHRSTYREGIFILQQQEKCPGLMSPISFIRPI